MTGVPPRPLSHLNSRRRARRTVATGAAIAVGIGHLALLLILSVSTPKLAGLRVEPFHPDVMVRLEPLRPATPPPKRNRPLAPRPPPPRPSQQARAAAAPAASVEAAPQTSPQTSPQASPQASSSPPNYGRWTVAPGVAPAQGPALDLAGCTPATVATLTGAAHDACARRLAEAGKNAAGLPPRGFQPDARQQAYAQAVRAWKSSPGMTPHPCPPQDEPAHKLYLDKCSLVNAARQVSGPLGSHAAVKVEFKLRF